MRSADIARQLLTFARKQIIAPRVINLNEMLAGLIKRLLRLIGEQIDLVWLHGSGLWPVKIDPAQVAADAGEQNGIAGVLPMAGLIRSVQPPMRQGTPLPETQIKIDIFGELHNFHGKQDPVLPRPLYGPKIRGLICSTNSSSTCIWPRY